MRWKAKKKPNNGDERVVSTFLFIPKKIGASVRWLEFSKIKQIYVRDGWNDQWIDLEFLN